MELYRTVQKEAVAEQTIERSRFIAHIKPIASREEADEFIAEKKADGTLEDVDENEESTKPEYDGLWAAIHARLAEFGFILRYPKGKEGITGYDYEPWHIRYLDDAEAAKAIMAREGLTLEEWFVEKNGER